MTTLIAALVGLVTALLTGIGAWFAAKRASEAKTKAIVAASNARLESADMRAEASAEMRRQRLTTEQQERAARPWTGGDVDKALDEDERN